MDDWQWNYSKLLKPCQAKVPNIYYGLSVPMVTRACILLPLPLQRGLFTSWWHSLTEYKTEDSTHRILLEPGKNGRLEGLCLCSQLSYQGSGHALRWNKGAIGRVSKPGQVSNPKGGMCVPKNWRMEVGRAIGQIRTKRKRIKRCFQPEILSWEKIFSFPFNPRIWRHCN